MAAQNNAALPEGLEVGGYRIVKKISSGGFSIVYLATDEQGQSVAIKEYMLSDGFTIGSRPSQRRLLRNACSKTSISI